MEASPHKPLETHGCIINTVAIDVLVLKHQAINNHSADLAFIVLPKKHTKMLHLLRTTWEILITFWKNLLIYRALRIFALCAYFIWHAVCQEYMNSIILAELWILYRTAKFCYWRTVNEKWPVQAWWAIYWTNVSFIIYIYIPDKIEAKTKWVPFLQTAFSLVKFIHLIEISQKFVPKDWFKVS